MCRRDCSSFIIPQNRRTIACRHHTNSSLHTPSLLILRYYNYTYDGGYASPPEGSSFSELTQRSQVNAENDHKENAKKNKRAGLFSINSLLNGNSNGNGKNGNSSDNDRNGNNDEEEVFTYGGKRTGGTKEPYSPIPIEHTARLSDNYVMYLPQRFNPMQVSGRS